LEKLRKATRRLFNKTKREGNWDAYWNKLTMYDHEIRKAKRRKYRTFCEAIVNTCEGARLHRAISKGVPESNQALRKEDNSYTIGSTEKLVTHFPGSMLQTDWNTPVTAQSTTDWAKAKSIVTTERLRWASCTFQPYKSPRPDGIQPILLQRAISQLATPIRKILISSPALGHIPTAWSIAKVVFIPKAGKKDITDPKSF